ncbi:uncharacterized protein K452DRAFT_308849 [Aplosporella prunicola CBS 121167]|uniref:Fungal N-terminal domain-containing protein n=1 Tax=Aplosporella prunicola CBS 121167 TaxID=1176127 RepID=A0A6A6BC53_9PEZI|nr:uncharacterized protein K452DRAFT_308849 [Aplosporella prunicola CBS 121167]KAF2141789.1 hypothetical protein K452DRAFT_308849 [Aplosporella prunicola CBS 121167]
MSTAVEQTPEEWIAAYLTAISIILAKIRTLSDMIAMIQNEWSEKEQAVLFGMDSEGRFLCNSDEVLIIHGMALEFSSALVEHSEQVTQIFDHVEGMVHRLTDSIKFLSTHAEGERQDERIKWIECVERDSRVIGYLLSEVDKLSEAAIRHDEQFNHRLDRIINRTGLPASL